MNPRKSGVPAFATFIINQRIYGLKAFFQHTVAAKNCPKYGLMNALGRASVLSSICS